MSDLQELIIFHSYQEIFQNQILNTNVYAIRKKIWDNCKANNYEKKPEMKYEKYSLPK